MAFDRHPRIIAHLLPRPGERVEQGALAGIGVADHCDQRAMLHAASGITRTARAWMRRIATVIRPTRTASGSRPNGPRWSGSTDTPASKPNWRNRLASLSASEPQST